MNEIEARGKIKYRIANEMRKVWENKEEYEDLEIALQVMKEIREYREIGTVEEFKALKDNQRKCEDCAGCTVWKCDCANERAYAIDEFVKNLRPLLSTFIDRIRLDKIAEQMKGGSE